MNAQVLPLRLYDPTQVRDAIGVLYQRGLVVEVRVLNGVASGDRRSMVWSGYFDNSTDLLRGLDRLTSAKGVYFTLNPVKPALQARSANKLTLPDKGKSTSDDNIAERRWLLIDLDAARPDSISADDEEHDAALARAEIVRAWLAEQGWPQPILADSGNGAHLLYRISLPNDPASTELCSRVLRALGARFSDPAELVTRAKSGDVLTPRPVEVDEKVFNASRICKLYGTLVCKGDSTDRRPHRMSRLLDVPEGVAAAVVPREALEKLAAEAPSATLVTPARAPSAPYKSGAVAFDLSKWVAEHLTIPIDGPEPWKGSGKRWTFQECPFNAEHGRGEAFLGEMPNGAIVAKCQHASCTWGWRELREKFEPGCYDRKERKRRREPQVPPRRENLPAGVDPAVCSNLTDLGNGERLRMRHGQEILWSPATGWLVWNGKVWSADDLGCVQRMAHDTIREIPRQAGEGLKTGALSHDQWTHQIEWALKSESTGRVVAMIEAARPYLGVDSAELNVDNWLLTVQNGTLDLRTGELLPHCRDHLITRMAGVTYDPEAECPRWLAFLDRVLAGDDELIAYVQQAVGYSLTGSTSEHALFFCYGVGANGKSTFLDTIKALLGEYSRQADFNSFTARQPGRQEPRNDLAALVGARFVTANEADNNVSLSEGTIKSVTGGDAITCRHLYKDQFEYTPTWKLWLAANHKPRTRDTSEGLWRRIKLIPFTVTIPEAERDSTLPAQLAEEIPGILNWSLEGLRAWQALGHLAGSAAVRAATTEYREENDQVALFLRDRCVVRAGCTATANDLFREYRSWAEEGGEQPCSATMFGKLLKTAGFAQKRTRKTRLWSGLGLLDREDQQGGGYRDNDDDDDDFSAEETSHPAKGCDRSFLADSADVTGWDAISTQFSPSHNTRPLSRGSASQPVTSAESLTKNESPGEENATKRVTAAESLGIQVASMTKGPASGGAFGRF